MRQKLSSSSGRKHFIVAYNLCETLKENKLEIECGDYKTIRQLISGISSKRFESRSNNIKNRMNQNMNNMSKEQME